MQDTTATSVAKMNFKFSKSGGPCEAGPNLRKHFVIKQQARPSLLVLCTLLLMLTVSPQVALSANKQRHFNHQSTTPAPATEPAAESGASSHTSHEQPATSHHETAISSQDSGSEQDYGSQDSGEYNSMPQPVDLSAIRIDDKSIVLKWDIDSSALETLQFFKIQYKSTKTGAKWQTDNKEIAATAKAHQINGLKPGSYFFIVSAVYNNNDHNSSESFKYRLKAKSKLEPDDWPELKAPVIYWHEAESDYIRFKWRYQFKQKDIEYYGYLVYYRSTQVIADFSIYNTLDENVEIVDLEPDTPYEAKVVAFNKITVSNFSDTIIIKTKPKSNSTTHSTTTPSTTTTTSTSTTTTTIAPIASSSAPSATRRPGGLVTNSLDDNNPAASRPPLETSSTPAPDQKPTGAGTISTPTNVITAINSNTTSNSSYHSLSSIIDLIIGGQSDTTLLIRFSIIFVPILFIVLALICFVSISCYNRRKHSPPSSTNESMQFDLEINGYFKNSFPGVEKEYSSTTNHNAPHGFVNNHPHINDFP